MIKETVQNQIKQYETQREQLNQQVVAMQQQITQLGANISAFNGAIQALEFVCAEIDKEDALAAPSASDDEMQKEVSGDPASFADENYDNDN